MTGKEFGKIYKMLNVSYEWFDAEDALKTKLWYEFLKREPYELLVETVKDWILTESKPPTISDLMTRMVDKVNGFCSAEVEFDKPYEEMSRIGKNAFEYMGGSWAWNHTTNPEAFRSQFAKAYNSFVAEERKKQVLNGIPQELIENYSQPLLEEKVVEVME